MMCVPNILGSCECDVRVTHTHTHITLAHTYGLHFLTCRLAELNASYNQLTSVPTSILALPNLFKLCLSHNKLQNLPGDQRPPGDPQNNGIVPQIPP